MAWYDWLTGKAEMDVWNNVASDVYHKVTGAPTAKEVRAQKQLMNQQIKAYKDQTELTRQQLDQNNAEMDSERRRVNEKQIRALRRNYSARGFLGSNQETEPGMSEKLGG